MMAQNNQSRSAAGAYAGACVGGALLGGIGGAVYEGIMQKGQLQRGGGLNNSMIKSVAIGAGAGCAIGLGATAIGKLLNEREQQRQDEVFQKAAQVGAEQAERERLQVEERYRNMPPAATETNRIAREQAKQREIQTAQSTQSSPEAWKDGNTRGQAIYIGPTKSPQTGEVIRTAGGKDCVTIKEIIMKDGVEASQETTACPASDGHWQRIEVQRT